MTRHTRGHWTNLNPGLDTLQYYSAAVGDLANGRAYWGGLQDNGETYWATGMSRVEQAFTGDGGDTIVDPDERQPGGRGVRRPRHVHDDRRAVQTLTEISPSCLTATDPPDPCDPNPRFIAPIEQDVHNPHHWVAGGQYVWDDHKAWNTVCAGATCDWKTVYDTGDGHQVTALADNGTTTYAGWCGPCNPATGAPFDRGLATNYGGSWHELSLNGLPNRYITSIAVDPANAGARVHQRRLVQPPVDPDAGDGHVFETHERRGHLDQRDGQPPRRAGLQARHPRRSAGRRAPRSARSSPTAASTAQLVAARSEPAERHGVGPGGDARAQHRGRGHARPRPVGAPAALTHTAPARSLRRPGRSVS